MSVKKIRKLIKSLEEFKLESRKKKDKTYAIYFKSVKLFEGMTDSVQADYLLNELRFLIERVTKKYKQYVDEQEVKTRQIENEIFGIPEQMEILNESASSTIVIPA